MGDNQTFSGKNSKNKQKSLLSTPFYGDNKETTKHFRANFWASGGIIAPLSFSGSIIYRPSLIFGQKLKPQESPKKQQKRKPTQLLNNKMSELQGPWKRFNIICATQLNLFRSGL